YKWILSREVAEAYFIHLHMISFFFCPHATFSGSYDMKGEPHEFNSHWKTEDCLECSCSKFGISCCATPVNFDEEKCVSIFNNTACAYEVVEKADHSKTCEVHEWVG
uniref:Beta-microseminoprotein n=1 Tax=Pavo cristatus TaxID=9049 RepID=A0A8C9EHX3_PAVCR